jgi:hypothetical protein
MYEAKGTRIVVAFIRAV